MASKEEILYLGKRKSEHMKDAVGAIIAASTPSGRWLMLKQGFLKFEPVARRALREDANLPFTSNELREIYEAVCRYARKKDHHLWGEIERMYAKNRRTSTIH